MRVAIGGISQETCSFSHITSNLEFFRSSGTVYFAEADQLLPMLEHTKTQIGGSIAAAREHNVDIVPLFAASAMSGGTLSEEALEEMLDRILDGLRTAETLDGVVLAMHGAMVSEKHDDATGYVMERVKEIIGDDVPLAVSLDLHANPNPLWTETADILISYHTYPHTDDDLYKTGYDSATLLFRTIRGEVSPVCTLSKAPVLFQPEMQATGGDGPFAEMQRAVSEAMGIYDTILSISLLPVQPWIDVPDIGFSVIVITDDDPELGNTLAERFTNDAWKRRYQFIAERFPPVEAIQKAMKIQGGPVVLADGADGVGGGAAGDGTTVLRALLDTDIKEPAYITCIDPIAVKEAIAAGFDKVVTVTVGGKRDTVFNTPVEVTGRVTTISDAVFHAYGLSARMGACVVLELGTVYLVLISNTVHVISPHVYSAVGLDPMKAKILVAKSPTQFREYFEPIAVEVILVDAPGVCSSTFTALPYKRITRPLFPWDDDFM